MEKKKLTRKELYDLVCTKPLTMLATEYSISVIGLRKICKEYNIPLPPNGHWSKLKFGKPSKLMELSDEFSGSLDVNLDEIKLVNNNDSPEDPITKKVKDIEVTTELKLKVPQKLINPDPLIVSTINYHDAIKRHDYRNDNQYPARTNVLNIDVSKDSLARAYRIMDTVIKLLRARKHDIKFKNFNETIVIAYGEEVEIRLREKNRVSAVKEQWGGRIFESTGILVFIIGKYPKKEFQDGLDQLEAKISSIIAYIEADAERNRKWRIEAEEERKRAEEKRRIDQGIKQQKDNESRRFKDLFLDATRLHQAKIMREYIRTVESNAIENQLMTIELKNWIKWANKKADWYDPLINGEDPILDDVYKMGLFKELLKEWQ